MGTHPSEGGTAAIPLQANDADIIPREFYASPGAQSSFGVTSAPFSTLLTYTISEPGVSDTPAAIAAIESINTAENDEIVAANIQ